MGVSLRMDGFVGVTFSDLHYKRKSSGSLPESSRLQDKTRCKQQGVCLLPSGIRTKVRMIF